MILFYDDNFFVTKNSAQVRNSAKFELTNFTGYISQQDGMTNVLEKMFSRHPVSKGTLSPLKLC